jgi:Transposase DNA-binding
MSYPAPAAPGAPLSFGEEHFAKAYLGDRRRTRCLVDLANRFARHPGGTLPQKCQDPNALRRCYDLLNVAAVTHNAVLQPHLQRTIRAVQQQSGVVLNLHDGSELDFSHVEALHDQLGQIGTGSGRGYQCLNSLAVLPQDHRVLGIVSQILYKRPQVPKNESRPQKRAREDRESLLWLQAVTNIEQASERYQRLEAAEASDRPLVVDVIDRGGDTFEFLDHEDRLGRHFLIRSEHNRQIALGHDQAGAPPARAADAAKKVLRLHDHLRTLPEQGRRTIRLSDRPERPARQAVVAIAWAAVRVYPPAKPRGNHRSQPLVCWGLRVWEHNPPAGVEAVDWYLLTNVAVDNAQQAWERVDWYRARWVIEEFHKGQKTGCAIEKPQFEKAERLEPLVALLSVVSLVLLGLRSASRDERVQEQPATEWVDQEYVEVLSGWRYQERRALTVREFYLALARLGGHQNRRKDRPPGWIVLWRGWTQLQAMVAGARAIRCPKKAPLEPPGADRCLPLTG